MSRKDGITFMIFVLVLGITSLLLVVFKEVDTHVEEVEPFSYDREIRCTNQVYLKKDNMKILLKEIEGLQNGTLMAHADGSVTKCK
jgi:hypothetical protein